MTDEEYRIEGNLNIQYAENLRKYHDVPQKAIAAYEEAINSFLKIEEKNSNDIAEIYDAYHTLAIYCFNLKMPGNYAKAAEYYLKGIDTLLAYPLNDSTYRQLTMRYIDLADACYESLNLSAGDAAILNAITAFRAIKDKNSKELGLGEPITNFMAFHGYYERKTSKAGYIASNKYKNHQSLFCQRLVAAQEEAQLVASFGSVSISKAQPMSHSIDAMVNDLSQLSMHSLFNPVLINQLPGDAGYRQMAMQLLQLAQASVVIGRIESTIASYCQVVNILKQMQHPTYKDLQVIRHVEQEIVEQKERALQQQRIQASQSGASTVQVLVERGIFAAGNRLLESVELGIPGLNDLDDDEASSAMQY